MRDLDQLELLEDGVLEPWRYGQPEFCGKHAERPGRLAHKPFHGRGASPIQLLHQCGPLRSGNLTRLDHFVDEETIREIRGDPARRGMRMEKVALGLKVAHRVPHGGSRHPQIKTLRDGPASRGLRGFDIGPHDGLEHLALAVAQRRVGSGRSIDRAHRVPGRG